MLMAGLIIVNQQQMSTKTNNRKENKGNNKILHQAYNSKIAKIAS